MLNKYFIKGFMLLLLKTFFSLLGLDILITTLFMTSNDELRKNYFESKILFNIKNDKADQKFKF